MILKIRIAVVDTCKKEKLCHYNCLLVEKVQLEYWYWIVEHCTLNETAWLQVISCTLLGFIGDIGFSFGGAEHDEESEDSEWTATPILVESVTRGSIAEKAGLEPGDEIIKARGRMWYMYTYKQERIQHFG